MVLEGLPTRVMMMMMIVVVVVAIQRWLLVTSQGRGASSDPVNRQIDKHKHTTYFFLLSFSFISMYFYFPSLFEKLGSILRTSFTLLF